MGALCGRCFTNSSSTDERTRSVCERRRIQSRGSRRERTIPVSNRRDGCVGEMTLWVEVVVAVD